jgi:hypothetical protein
MSRVRLTLAILALVTLTTAGVVGARSFLDWTSAEPAAASTTTPANINGRIPEDQLVTIDTGHRHLPAPLFVFDQSQCLLPEQFQYG